MNDVMNQHLSSPRSSEMLASAKIDPTNLDTITVESAVGRELMTGPISLPPRQVDCLRGIAAGQTTQEIAQALGLSRHTVDHYVGSACDRLNARSRAHAVAIAISLGLLSGSDKPTLGEK